MKGFTTFALLAMAFEAYALQGNHDHTNFAGSARESFGWVCDGGSNPLEVRFYHQGQLVGQTLANVQREVAVHALCGNSDRGFVWPYPAWMKDGVTREVTAKAVIGNEEIDLPGTPVSVFIPSEVEPIGWFDFISPEYVFGWSCDPSSFELGSASITIYDESGTVVSEGQTNLEREAALTPLCGSRFRGFQLEIPISWQDHQRHTFLAYATNKDGGGTRLIGMMSATIHPQVFNSYGVPRQVTPANIDDVVGAAVAGYEPPDDGLLRINTYFVSALQLMTFQWDGILANLPDSALRLIK